MTHETLILWHNEQFYIFLKRWRRSVEIAQAEIAIEKANLIHELFMTNFCQTPKVLGCENMYAAGFVTNCLCRSSHL